MNTFRISLALLCAVLAAAFVSCSDNPADTPSGDHIEAFGLVIYNSGEEIVRYQNGVVTGEIEVAAGEDTPLLSVRFLDENGAIIGTDKVSGSEHSLKWAVGNTDVAEVEHHDDDGKWNLHISGKQEGETTLKIILNHNDHADFTSKEIPVHVQAGVTGLKLLLNGVQILTADTEAASGTLSMVSGTAGTIELRFTDGDGNTKILEEEHLIEIAADDVSFVDITAGQTNGTFLFTPKKAGSTSFRVYLKREDEHQHGEPGVLYTSAAIVLSIEE